MSPDRAVLAGTAFSGLSQLRSQLDSLLSGWDELLSGTGAFTPLADLEETAEAYLAEIKLPGVKLDDLGGGWPVAD